MTVTLSCSSRRLRTTAFDDLVQQHDDGDDHELRPPGHSVGSPARSASTHRSQMPDHSGSLRTRGTKRQQRSHFTPGAFSTVDIHVIRALGCARDAAPRRRR